MPTKRLNQIFKELSFDKKLLGIGSLIMIISVFLPWYQDLDSFKTGDMFLGITGPAYLAGVSLLLLAGMNLFLLSMDYLGKKISWLPMKNGVFYMFVGIFALYVLVLVNSVYFHAKFGVNITLKQSQFGMFTAFIAAGLITVGGYLSLQDKGAILKEFREKTQEPMIKVPEQDRKPEKGIKSTQSEETVKEDVPVNAESVEQMQMGSVEEKTANIDEPAAEPVAARVSAAVEPTSDDPEQKDPPQPYRMDL